MEDFLLFRVTFKDGTEKYVYGHDEAYVAEKAEKQYRKEPMTIELLDTSREHDPKWLDKTFGGTKRSSHSAFCFSSAQG